MVLNYNQGRIFSNILVKVSHSIRKQRKILFNCCTKFANNVHCVQQKNHQELLHLLQVLPNKTGISSLDALHFSLLSLYYAFLFTTITLVCYSPTFLYSWSIGHILEHEFFCLGAQGSKEEKKFSISEQLFENIVASALKNLHRIKVPPPLSQSLISIEIVLHPFIDITFSQQPSRLW